jgi:hypothetical protein
MRKTDNQRLLPQTFEAPDPIARKHLPDLQRQCELDRLAGEINKAHAEIEVYSRTVLEAGTEAIKRAIACGTWLRTVKAALKHGDFEDWCARHLKSKIRKVQNYMLLAKRHAARDILKQKPQSLRQALIYVGVLPKDTDKRHHSAKFDELAWLRKAVHRLLKELKANEDNHAEELLHETESLVEWRNQLVATLAAKEKPAIAVDIVAEVMPVAQVTAEPRAEPKAHHDALLPALVEKPRRTKKKKVDEALKANALRDYKRGDSLKGISIRCGYSQASISLWAKAEGLERRKQGCRFKDWPDDKDIEIVSAVKAIRDGKPTYAEIGKRWHTSRANVNRIYHTWKDWVPTVRFRQGEIIRLNRCDYEVIEPGPFEGKVRALKTNQESTIRWRSNGHIAVRL